MGWIKTNFPVRGRKHLQLAILVFVFHAKIKTNFPVRGRKLSNAWDSWLYDLRIKTNFPVRGRKRRTNYRHKPMQNGDQNQLPRKGTETSR